MQNFAHPLPSFPGFFGPKTYAAWPVWSDSARAEVKFQPVPKKHAVRLYQKARAFNRMSKSAGRYGGMLGSSALRVLECLIFDFLNFASGRLDPSYAAIARKTGLGRSTVAKALARLKQLRIVNWLRRCAEDRGEAGQYRLRQETNAYAVLPATQWLGFDDPEIPVPSPHPTTWGATPPLPELLAQAVEAVHEGASLAAIASILDSDPGDTVAAALASFGRSMNEAKS